MHVRVIDSVVKASIGHCDDDASAVQSVPATVNAGHVGVIPKVIDVHDLDTFTVQNFEEGFCLNPFNLLLTCEPRQAFGVNRHGCKTA